MVFECGQHHKAISSVEDLVDSADDKSVYITVLVRTRRDLDICAVLTGHRQAQMNLLLGRISMKRGDNERAVTSFKLALEVSPVRDDPYLQLISLASLSFLSSSLPLTRSARYLDGILIAFPLKFSQTFKAVLR